MGKQFWKQSADRTEAPPPEHPYWRKTCDLCGGKGTHHFKGKVVCRRHLEALKEDLEKDIKKWSGKQKGYGPK